MNIWLFWGIAGAIGAMVAAILLRALRRGADAEPASAYDLRVYRDQLREVDRDLARGVIAPEDAERLRAEVSRRLLDTDRAPAVPGGGTGPARLAAGLVVLGLLGAGAGYWRLGAPGYPDMPMQARLALADEIYQTRQPQTEAEAAFRAAVPESDAGADPAFLELMVQLRAAVATRPTDRQGHELLARNEAALGRFAAAAAAQREVIALKGDAADADDQASLAELMILAAGGYVSPEAEAALTEALRIDPKQGLARYYSGQMLAQTGRPDLAFRLWRALLEDSPPAAPWVEPLRAQIGAIADRAGVTYTPPVALPGPSAEDMQAAGDLSDADRAAMVEGMVAQLNDRLARDGGTAQEWARLIAAYGVLGQTDRATAIWLEAQTRFADRAADLDLIRAAARQANVAGVIE